jgi:acetyl-CoA synthetase
MDKPVSSSHSVEGEVYYPFTEVVAAAHAKEYEALYQRSLEDPEGFWGERAEELKWFHTS